MIVKRCVDRSLSAMVLRLLPRRHELRILRFIYIAIIEKLVLPKVRRQRIEIPTLVAQTGPAVVVFLATSNVPTDSQNDRTTAFKTRQAYIK